MQISSTILILLLPTHLSGVFFNELSYNKINELYPDINRYLKNICSDELIDIKITKNIVQFIKMLKNVDIPYKEKLFNSKYDEKWYIIHLKKENIYIFLYTFGEKEIGFNVIVNIKTNKGNINYSLTKIMRYLSELNKKYIGIVNKYVKIH